MVTIKHNQGIYEAISLEGTVLQSHECPKTLSRSLHFKGVEHQLGYNDESLTLL